jgi:hypothetical protein
MFGEEKSVPVKLRRKPVVGRPAELVGQFAERLVTARLHGQDADPHALSPSARRRLAHRPEI